MRISIKDGIKTLHLSDHKADARALPSDAYALFHLFSLLNGNHGGRDRSIFERRLA